MFCRGGRGFFWQVKLYKCLLINRGVVLEGIKWKEIWLRDVSTLGGRKGNLLPTVWLPLEKTGYNN